MAGTTIDTHPDPSAPASSLTFAAIGDFGVGVRKASVTRRQQQVADALRHAVDGEGIRLVLTTGDNIYAGKRLLGIPVGATGAEDDDWFFTYFQPYYYIINRIPVYPSIGNHEAAESEDCDDRSRPEIQKFAGALQGQRARKGVFITTSTFTAEARSFVGNIESKIVLIDGPHVGAPSAAVYEVKNLDVDFFEED